MNATVEWTAAHAPVTWVLPGVPAGDLVWQRHGRGSRGVGTTGRHPFLWLQSTAINSENPSPEPRP
jgi:hypothetical protein